MFYSCIHFITANTTSARSVQFLASTVRHHKHLWKSVSVLLHSIVGSWQFLLHQEILQFWTFFSMSPQATWWLVLKKAVLHGRLMPIFLQVITHWSDGISNFVALFWQYLFVVNVYCLLVRALRWALSDPYYHFACLYACPVSSPVHPLLVDWFGWNLAVRTHLGSNSLLWSFSHLRPLAAELWTKNVIFRGVTPNKKKRSCTCYSATYMSRLKTSGASQSRKWRTDRQWH